MSVWTEWFSIDLAKSHRGPLNEYGVYQIRVTHSNGRPIPISRFVDLDSLGLIYVGRSGYRRQRTGRTVATRIREFLQQAHSGGITYSRAQETLRRTRLFKGHRLQVRARFLPDDQIDAAEAEVLREYFSKHAELPPCNSALPNLVRNIDDS